MHSDLFKKTIVSLADDSPAVIDITYEHLVRRTDPTGVNPAKLDIWSCLDGSLHHDRLLDCALLQSAGQNQSNYERSDCLILFGEHETLFNPYKLAERAKKLMPQAQIHIIKGAGHGCIYDQPQETNARIIEFLKLTTTNRVSNYH